MTEFTYIPSETCKFPEEATAIAGLMRNFSLGVRIKIHKVYPHPHTLSNLKRLARMPIEMLI